MHMGGSTIGELKSAIAVLQYYRDSLASVNYIYAGISTLLISLALCLWCYLKTKKRLNSKFDEEIEAQLSKLQKMRDQDEWEEIESTAEMKETENRIIELLGLHEQLENEQIEQSAEIREQIIAELDYLYKNLDFLDVQRRLNIEIDPEEVQHAKPKNFMGKLNIFFISRGLMSNIRGLSKFMFSASVLLLIPSMMVAASPVINEIVEKKYYELDDKLVQLEIKVSLEDSRQKWEQLLKPEKDNNEISSDDEKILDELAREFESETIYVRSAAQLGIQAANLATRVSIKNHGVKKGILTAVAKNKSNTIVIDRSNFQTTQPITHEILRAQDHINTSQVPVTEFGKKFRGDLETIAKDNKTLWKNIKQKASTHAKSYQKVASLREIKGMMVSNVLGNTMNSINIDSEFGKQIQGGISNISSDAANRIYEIESKRYMTALVKSESLQAVKESLQSAEYRSYTKSEQRYIKQGLQSLPSDNHLYSSLENYPPSIERIPHSNIDFKSSQDTLVKLASLDSNGRIHPAAFEAMSNFNDYFPAYQGAENNTPKSNALKNSGNGFNKSKSSNQSKTQSQRNFVRARSYASLKGYSRVGGVLIGREPEKSNDDLNITDINWNINGNKVTLELIDINGKTNKLGPFKKKITNLALAYAADGRATTVTMVTANPLTELKILLHPTLEDTPLGCKAIEIDQVTDSYTNRYKAAEKVRSEEVSNAITLINLYNLSRALRINTLRDDFLNQYSGIQPELADFVRQATNGYESIFKNSNIVNDSDHVLKNKDQSFELYSQKSEFFDPELVSHIKSCHNINRSLEEYSKCLNRKVLNYKYEYFNDENLNWVAPATQAQPWSGVREIPYLLDSDFNFVKSPEHNPIWPFKFIVQLAFTSPPFFIQSKEPWFSSSNEKINFYSDNTPWQFVNTNKVINRGIASEVKKDGPYSQTIKDMQQFAQLQRLFRMALNSHFGQKFPVEKLVSLASETSSRDKNNYRTFRWNVHPGSLENNYYKYLKEQLPILSENPDTLKIAKKVDACMNVMEKAKTNRNLIKISQKSWSKNCLIDDKSGRSKLEKVSKRINLIRKLRYDLGLNIDDTNKLNGNYNTCPVI